MDTSAESVKKDQPLHKCYLYSEYEIYGVAIDDCYERTDGTLWAGNGQYGSQVNYCPVCGFEAKVRAK